MGAHDRHLDGYRVEDASLVCADCGARRDGRVVHEYGTSTTEPEECPDCRGPLEPDGAPDGPDPDLARDRALED